MPEICPFLVANHDPDSVLNYPTQGNVCTKLGEPHPVATGHQASYCLRARYWFCPVYAGAVKQPPTPIQFDDTLPVPPPKATRARAEHARRSRRIRPGEALAALFLVTVVGVGGGLWYTAHNSITILPTASLNPSPSQIIAVSPSTTLTASATVTSTS